MRWTFVVLALILYWAIPKRRFRDSPVKVKWVNLIFYGILFLLVAQAVYEYFSNE